MSTTLRITLAEYDAMIAADAFAPLGDRRIELIHGEIREMNPPGPTHEDIVDWLTHWSTQPVLRKRVRVRVQNSVGFPGIESAPQPDLAWVKPRRYAGGRPKSEEILLIIEVAHSSLDYDLGEKADLYAAGGVADYWVVDVPNRQVHVFRGPADGKYQDYKTADVGDNVSPLAAEDVFLSVAELFDLSE